MNVQKNQGMISPSPFSLFNNPDFISVASKIGVDVDFKNTDVSSSPLENAQSSDRTVGSESVLTTPP